MIKLTIGIPAFNSCNELKKSIEIILDQIKALKEIEVLICDNSSDDNTQVVVEGYIKKHPNIIRYIRHEVNLGMDRNFWSIIKNSKGDFVHFLGDDDYYMEYGIERIMKIIQSNTLDAILLSNNYLNTCNGQIIENKDPYNEDILCESGDVFFQKENLKTLCLSNVVVKRSKCIEITDIEKYFGCQWLHIALLIQIIKPESTSYIFNFKKPVVTVRIGNQKWLEKDGAVVFYYKALLVFSELKKSGYNRSIFENIKIKFLPLISGGNNINFYKKSMNILYSFKFFRFYYNKPVQYITFCIKLIFRKHRPFFEGWDKLK